MINDDLVMAHRARGLTPDNPVIRGTAQNPDVFFQARESANPFYEATPAIVQEAMDQFAELTGALTNCLTIPAIPKRSGSLSLWDLGPKRPNLPPLTWPTKAKK
jgi:pyruvate-ferredoxin/flavodoxin oxidoreductase